MKTLDVTNELDTSNIQYITIDAYSQNPYIIIGLKQHDCDSAVAMSLNEIATFLPRAIANGALSEEAKNKILNFFGDDFQYKNGEYLYIGPVYNNEFPDIEFSIQEILLNEDGNKINLTTAPLQEIASPKWYDTSGNFDELVNLAANIIASYPNDRIYSLGQSPSWIVKTAELLAAAEGKNIVLGYIPFSSFFYDHKSLIRSEKVKYEDNYRSFLKKKKMDINSIINSFEENNQKTILLEYVELGYGLTSFLSVLFSWAVEEGKEKLLYDAIKIVTLQDDGSKRCLTFGEFDFKFNILECNKKLLNLLTLGIDEGKGSYRLVPSYKPEDWHSDPKPITENKELTSLLTHKLQLAVDDYLEPVSPIELLFVEVTGDNSMGSS